MTRRRRPGRLVAGPLPKRAVLEFGFEFLRRFCLVAAEQRGGFAFRLVFPSAAQEAFCGGRIEVATSNHGPFGSCVDIAADDGGLAVRCVTMPVEHGTAFAG